ALAQNPSFPTSLMPDVATRFPREFLENAIFSLMAVEAPGFLNAFPDHALKAIVLSLDHEIKRDWVVMLLEALDDKNEAKRFLADQNKTTGELLNEWARDHDVYLRLKVAKHLNTSSVVLSSLAKDPENLVRLEVAQNPNTTIETLSSLAEDPDSSVRFKVAQNPNTSAMILSHLAQDQNREVLREVVINPNTPITVLCHFANSSDFTIRSWVALNPSTPIEILKIFAQESNEEISSMLALNPSTPIEILSALAQDNRTKVRSNVAVNAKASATILSKLALDSDGAIRSWVAKHHNTFTRVLAYLSRDPSREVRMHVAENPNTSDDILHNLAQQSDEGIRVHVSANPNAPSKILVDFAQDSNDFLRLQVAEHSNTPRAVLQNFILSDTDWEVVSAATQNLRKRDQIRAQPLTTQVGPGKSPAFLKLSNEENSFWKVQSVSDDKKIIILQNSTDSSVIAEAYNDGNHFFEAGDAIEIVGVGGGGAALSGIQVSPLQQAQDPSTPNEVLEELWNDRDQYSIEVARAIAQNPSTPSLLLEIIFQNTSQDPSMQRRIALNPNISLSFMRTIIGQYSRECFENPVLTMEVLNNPDSDLLGNISLKDLIQIFHEMKMSGRNEYLGLLMKQIQDAAEKSILGG
ncbi:MAG: hypothetical protein JNK65_09540, partial [Deltaproteobacteria bacterium]|nr:hypothetical protein [Deltaproteobacteria bacterium]